MTQKTPRKKRTTISFDISADLAPPLLSVAQKHNYATITAYLKSIALRQAGLSTLNNRVTIDPSRTAIDEFIANQETIISETRNLVAAVMGYMKQQAENDFANFTTIRNLTDEVRSLTMQTQSNDSASITAIGAALIAIIDELKSARQRERLYFPSQFALSKKATAQEVDTGDDAFDTITEHLTSKKDTIERGLHETMIAIAGLTVKR
jgi:phytoene/squalene synthetase